MELTKQDIKNALWERGVLNFKFTHAEYEGRIVHHEVQSQMYDVFKNAEPNSTLVWLLSRQTGKTYFLGILALMQAFAKEKSVIKVLTDTKLHIESIFIPIIDSLLEDCPDYLKPRYDKSRFVYYFPNGSQIQLAGTDNKHYERLRGSKCHLVLIDEAGFCEDLDYIIKSVIIPTTTHTGGKIVLASTPPKHPDHDFVTFIEEAELNGTLVKKNIYDNPLLSTEQINNIIKKMGGIDSIAFRREYLCEIIKDDKSSVFPEFDEHLIKEIVTDWAKPNHYDSYVGMDLGGSRDLTAVLFLYYDFMKDRLVIEDELVFNHNEMLLPTLVADIIKKEEELWTSPITNEKIGPLLRVSDLNHIAIQEITRQSDNKLVFQKAKKDDKEMAVNTLRTLLSQRKIVIHPRCKNLIRHLNHCKWKKGMNVDKVFDRSVDNGHYDCVDALIYAVRSVNFRKNPYPAGYGMDLRTEDVYYPTTEVKERYSNKNQLAVFNKIFKKK